MPPSLPSDPAKRRKAIFKRAYQSMASWRALMDDQGMDSIITTPDGEDIYYNDLLVGLCVLPPRQRQAFELICLQGYTETAARDVLMPNSKSSTPVQQYADIALTRMIEAYDNKQRGIRPAPRLARKGKKSATKPNATGTSPESTPMTPQEDVSCRKSKAP